MKKNKNIIWIFIIVLISVFSICIFAGCDFVQYVENPQDKNVVTEEVVSLREEYVSELLQATSSVKYRDKEQKLYEYALQDAINELNECLTETQLKDVYSKHIIEIGKIKTEKEYLEEEENAYVNAYRAAILSQANNSYDKQKYAESQIIYLEKVYSELSSGLSNTVETEVMNSLLKIFYFDIYKEDEILSIINFVDISIYPDLQAKILTSTLDKCIEDIRACASEDNIDAIKDIYKFEVYRQDTIKKINAYVDFGLYRKEQVEELKIVLQEHLTLAENAITITDADNVYREYQIAVYDIPTDEMLYSNELIQLKEELNSSLINTYKLSLYRESESKSVQELLHAFTSSLANISKKEDALSLFVVTKSNLDSVKTSKEIDEEDRVKLIEDLYNDLLIKIEKNIDGEEKEKFLIKADTTKSAMQDRISLDSIRVEYRILANEIAMKYGAEIELIKMDLQEFNSSVYYRENEQIEVNTLKAKCLEKFTADISIEEARIYLQETKSAIMLIKTNDDLWNDSLTKFRSDLREFYGNDILEEPASLTEANDYYELADIVDYYAFYQLSGTEFVCDTFRVKLNFDHNDAESEINNFYWNCELLRSGAGINGWIECNHFLVLKLIPFKLAISSNVSTTEKIIPNNSLIKFKSDKNKLNIRGSDFQDFPFMNLQRTLYGIWNSQQLWYALENDYKPICLPGSPAEIVFNRAKNLLRNIILEGMSEEEKIFQIYSWFAENVQYDHQYKNDFYQSILEKYPEAAQSKAFHAEGALLDGLAVCEGYAKAYLILLRIENIESYRIVQSSSLKGHIISAPFNQVFFVGYKSHAFVAIKMSDGYLYYSDPENSFVTGAEFLQQFQQCLIPPNLYDGYSGIIYFNPEIESATNLSDFYDNLYFDDKKLFVKNKDDIINILDSLIIKLPELERIQLSIFCDVRNYTNFQNDIFNILNDFDFKIKSSNSVFTEFTEIIIYN